MTYWQHLNAKPFAKIIIGIIIGVAIGYTSILLFVDSSFVLFEDGSFVFSGCFPFQLCGL